MFMSIFLHTQYHWLIHSILFLSLLKPITPYLSFSQSLFPYSNPSSPELPHPLPSPPHHQSEGTGSIVIGLQSWQPYDWAVGYCNWIRLEISSVPVRLLKSQSVVHSWRPPFALFFFVVNGSHSQLPLVGDEVTLSDHESDIYKLRSWQLMDLFKKKSEIHGSLEKSVYKKKEK